MAEFRFVNAAAVTLAVLWLSIGQPAAALAERPAPSLPGIDAPELAKLGEWAVGTTVTTIVLPGRVRLAPQGRIEDRSLEVRVWYPAIVAAGTAPVSYEYSLRRPGAPALAIRTPGIAVERARPIAGKRFPLVVVSHGYGGWGTFMSHLTENLASKGYVVAAIDHADLPFIDATGFALSFGSVVLDRAQDQRGVIARLLADARRAKTGYAALIDRERVGLIGYSMGGFGGLASAGAAYDPASTTTSQLPAAARAALLKDSRAAQIDALVLIAPWGGQPANRSWTADALARVTAPTLMIAGDNDDIVDFPAGVRWIFARMKGAERRLLVYRGARHNVGGNPAPTGVAGDFSANEYFAEPVWRGDRLNAINQHFITAFLDLTLKGDRAKAAYLDVPTPIASDGQWPAGSTGATAADAQPGYWRGFQRRWALGLELHRLKPGE